MNEEAGLSHTCMRAYTMHAKECKQARPCMRARTHRCKCARINGTPVACTLGATKRTHARSHAGTHHVPLAGRLLRRRWVLLCLNLLLILLQQRTPPLDDIAGRHRGIHSHGPAQRHNAGHALAHLRQFFEGFCLVFPILDGSQQICVHPLIGEWQHRMLHLVQSIASLETAERTGRNHTYKLQNSNE